MLRRGEGIVQKKEIKAALFDLDGVLVDSIKAWYHIFNDTLIHFGHRTLSREEFSKGFGSPIEEDIKKYYEGRTVQEVEDEYNKNFKKRKSLVKIFPDSMLVLEELERRKVKIALISNSSRFIVMKILRHFKIGKYFEAIVTMDDVNRRKPAPDMPLKACDILGVKPEEAVLIGDTINDITSGKKAGCTTIGYAIEGDLKINKLTELLDIIVAENLTSTQK